MWAERGYSEVTSGTSHACCHRALASASDVEQHVSPMPWHHPSQTCATQLEKNTPTKESEEDTVTRLWIMWPLIKLLLQNLTG